MTLSENEGASLEGVHTQTWSCNESWDQCVHQILPRDEESNLESRAKRLATAEIPSLQLAKSPQLSSSHDDAFCHSFMCSKRTGPSTSTEILADLTR